MAFMSFLLFANRLAALLNTLDYSLYNIPHQPCHHLKNVSEQSMIFLLSSITQISFVPWLLTSAYSISLKAQIKQKQSTMNCTTKTGL